MNNLHECTILDVYEFYKLYPEYIGQLDVKSRHGYNKIEFADITAYNSNMYKIETEAGKSLMGSPDHLLFTQDGWTKIKNLKLTDKLLTVDGYENILLKNKMVEREDLYDLQVADVHEFYANDIVSHNSSSILDTIYFGLFGKPFRNINKPGVINSINNGDLVVTLEFTVNKKDYKIIRGMRPNIFEIYENDNLINQESATKDYQKFLEDSILGGLNERVFKQVVIIGSADYKPFMQLSSAHRREIIEELLDIKIFSQMLDVAKEKNSILKESIKDIDYKIDLEEAKINIEKTNQQKKKLANKNKAQEFADLILKEEQAIKVIDDKISSIKETNIEYKNKLTPQSLVQSSVTDLRQLLSNLKSSLKTNKSILEFFNSNESCPTCKQNITHDHKSPILLESSKKVTDISEAITKVESEIEKKQKILDTFDKISAAVRKNTDEISKLEIHKSNHVRFISSYKQEIVALNTITEEIASDLDKYIKSCDDLKHSRKALHEERTYYEAVLNMLKDTGIKSRIIKQYIPVMNKIINDYLIRFGLPIEFTLDEQFNEVIRSRYRDGFQYNNFSEGEKQRVDLSLLFAWRQIAKTKNTTNTNLLILDETMDSSLDANATEELLNLLLQMDKNTNIFLISHKQDLSDKMRSIIEFEKVGNFTRIKPKN